MSFLKSFFTKPKKYYFSSSEAVSSAHPDRLCDDIAAIIIQDIQALDGPNSHAAIEVFATHDSIVIGGEATTTLELSTKYLRSVVSKAFKRTGYIPEMRKFWSKQEVALASNFDIINKIASQSPDIALGTTDKGEDSGWNDQGVYFSSSERTTSNKLGTPHMLATSICEQLQKLSKDTILHPELYLTIDDEFVLGPDNKSVVTVKVEEDGYTPVEVTAITIAVPHSSKTSIKIVREWVKDFVTKYIEQCGVAISPDCQWVINGTGRYVSHGPIADTSMTGRKISVNHPSAGPVWCNKMIGGGCLPQDTLVRTMHGDVPIQDLYKGDKVVVRGVEHTVEESVYSGLKEVWEIKTKDGRVLMASTEHNVRVASLEEFSFKEVGSLKEGDYLCVDLNGTFGELRVPHSYVYGCLLGDGYMVKRDERLCLYYPEFDKDEKPTIEFHKVFPHSTQGVIHREGCLDEWYSRTNKEDAAIVEEFKALGFNACGAQFKSIPEVFFTEADSTSVADLLQGLFDTDGCVSHIHGHQDSVRITYDSVSEDLIRGIQRLLLKFGISSLIRKRDTSKNTSFIGSHEVKSCGWVYKLSINGLDSIEKFINCIGFGLKRKALKLQELTYQQTDKSIVLGIRNELLEYYNSCEEFRAFCREKRLDSFRKLLQQGKNQKTGYDFALCKVNEVLKFPLLPDNLRNLLIKATSYCYDEIVSITPLGEMECFDIQVEGVNEYVASDFSVHNSLIKPAHASDLILNITARYIANVVVASGLSDWAVVGCAGAIGVKGIQSLFVKGDKCFESCPFHDAVISYFQESLPWSPIALAKKFKFFDASFDFGKVVDKNFFGHPECQPWEDSELIEEEVSNLRTYLDIA